MNSLVCIGVPKGKGARWEQAGASGSELEQAGSKLEQAGVSWSKLEQDSQAECYTRF